MKRTRWKKFRRVFSLTMLVTGLLMLLPAVVQAQGGDELSTADLALSINTVWVLIAGFLVFFMQAGFGFLEAGFVRSKNVVNIMAENFLDTTMTTMGFWAAGFGIMFGSGTGLFGTEWFFLQGLPETINGLPPFAFFFFQFAFSAAASTIASGLMAERTDFRADLIYSFLVGLIIYPVVGHWVWGSDGWLAGLGFMDFAGSTVVHLVGALVGLAGTLVLGKRIDKEFGKTIRGHNIPLAAIGTFILWLGWFGFNPGSTLGATDANAIALIVLNTDFAATTGAIVAIFLSYAYTRTWDVSMAFNGALGGLVAITAPCAFVDPTMALLIGVIAGGLTYYGVGLMETLKIDDPVGAFPVHGMNGLFGTLAVGLFATEGGLFFGGGFEQLGVQAVGVVAAIAYVFPVSLVMFYAIKLFFGLRVDEAIERAGIDGFYHGISSYPEFTPGAYSLPTMTKASGPEPLASSGASPAATGD
ncbi:MAG: ammonium transporter [Anaerolineae bacterium]|nr:ammonium transporter [Anaerolineae bacterium]